MNEMRIGKLVFMLALGGCTAAYTTVPVTAVQTRVSAADRALVRSRIAENMRDPEAVRIKALVGYRLNTGDLVVCGDMNAKNAYGGYIGYTPFYARLHGQELAGYGDGTEDGSYDDNAVIKACADLASGNAEIYEPTP